MSDPGNRCLGSLSGIYFAMFQSLTKLLSVASIVGSAFGASSSIGGSSFSGSSASIVLVISGSTSDIYNILYILSIF